jgi:hypothetical protein
MEALNRVDSLREFLRNAGVCVVPAFSTERFIPDGMKKSIAFNLSIFYLNLSIQGTSSKTPVNQR